MQAVLCSRRAAPCTSRDTQGHTTTRYLCCVHEAAGRDGSSLFFIKPAKQVNITVNHIDLSAEFHRPEQTALDQKNSRRPSASFDNAVPPPPPPFTTPSLLTAANACRGGGGGGGGGAAAPARTITMYIGGFTVDDGPFRRLDDPANKEFLKDLANGCVVDRSRSAWGRNLEGRLFGLDRSLECVLQVVFR